MKNNLKKNFIWNLIGSVLNATTSLFFLIIITRINGLDDAGIFTFAFSTACLLQVIGLYSGRTYQVTDSRENDYDYIYQRVILFIIMILSSIIFSIIKGYGNYKFIVILSLVIYKAIEALSEVFYGIIQKNNDLYKVGISLFLKGILGLLFFIVIDIITHNVILSSLSLIIVNTIILVLYDIKNIKKYNIERCKFNKKRVLKLFKLGMWAFLFTFLTQYVINAPKYAIDNHLNNDLQTIYGIVAMPATLMILCSQFLIHPFLNSLSKFFKEKDFKKFNILVIKIMLSLVIIGLLATLTAYIIGIPFLELVYGISLRKYLMPLIFIIIGATIFGLSYILSNALTTIRKTFVQVSIFFIDSIFTYIMSNYLVLKLNVLGASFSYLSSMILLFVLYLIVYIFEIKKEAYNE